jgi:hypothetical protein
MVEIQLAHGKAPLIAGEKRILGVHPECYRAGGIRTRGLLHPRQALYQAEPQPELLPRSNQRAHLSRVLRAHRQDRISEHLRPHGRNLQVVCTRVGRLPVETTAPNQTNNQTINLADEIYSAAPHGGAEESACTKPLRSNQQLGKERSFPGREPHRCWLWKSLTHPNPWAPRRTGH